MSFYDNHYYYLNKRFLSIVGQWPFQSRLESNVMLAIALLFLCSLTALEFLGLIAGITDMNIIMENTSPLLINSFIFVKLINSLCNKYKMKDLLERIEETWKMTQIGPENEILRSYAEQSRTLTIQYALGLYSMWISYSTMPIVVSEIYSLLPTNETYTARFLYRLEHLLDVEKYFNLLMLHGIISVFYIVSVVIAIDGMFVLCIQHACALFEGIKYKIQHIGSRLDFVTLKPNIMDDEAFHVIIDCIKSYKRAVKFSDLLSSTFETCFFFLLGNVVIALSFNAAELIMIDIQLDEIIRILAANIAQLLHIFYLSLMSQRLIDHSSGLQEAIYSCEWYKISLRSRQLLRFTLMRVVKPCQIKAGKIYVMSMENFSSILQVSMSYFTMLTSIYKMSFYDNHYYYLNKRFLSIIGQWPFQSRLESNVMLAIALLFLCSLTALEFLGLIAGITDMNIIMENTSPLLINSFIFVKLINSLCNKYKMKDLLERIEETWKMTQIGPENEILRNYAEQSRTLTIQYALGLYSVWIFYSTMPIVVSEIYSLLPTNETYTARYLFRLEHLLDVDKYFNLLMLHGIISVFYIVSVAIAVDGMFVLCIQHACALFEGIKYKIQHVRGFDFVTLKPNIMDDEAFHVIIDCIKLYKRALKFSDLLSSTYETCFFFLLGNIVIALSFNAAELIIMDVQLDEIIRIVAANMGQLLHIFYLSLMSQRLIDHSSELQEAIYSCEWYKISLRSRQLLRFTLMRVIKPCQIKAGKIYVMSMENFSSILKVSVSYFTMLTSMQ
ncbi:uncharacterized protein [Polyergus mexicanus]|uniref:uncharacterized protein n=1 Tax=Polyergus mexicanus TaxID=615972 RepID=UPI0038B671A7